MQAIVVALLLRPINSYRYKEKNLITEKSKELKIIGKRKQECPDNRFIKSDVKLVQGNVVNESQNLGDIEQQEKETLLENYDLPVTHTKESKVEHDTDKSHDEVKNKGIISIFQPKYDSSELRDSAVYSSVLPTDQSKDSLSAVPLTKEDGKPQQNVKQNRGILLEHCSWLKDMLQIFNPTLFQHYVCLVLCTAYSLNICAMFVLMYLPTYAQSVGVSKTDSASLLTIAGVAEFGGRLLSGLLGDQKWLRPATIISMSSLALSVTCQLAGLLQTFWALAGFALVIGLLGCFGQNLMSVLIVDVLGNICD